MWIADGNQNWMILTCYLHSKDIPYTNTAHMRLKRQLGSLFHFLLCILNTSEADGVVAYGGCEFMASGRAG
jgi:hypothetical protein